MNPASNRRASAASRLLDVTVSVLGLALCLPLILLVAALIFLEDRGPVFYRQRRAGRDGRGFELLKFRSMRVNELTVEEMGQVREDHQLVTRVGRVIRRLKIDELPQLANVLRGDMSLVGPRPTVPEQAARYDEFARRRLRLRPGMTGWAQVHGNTRLSWAERIALDVWYVDHRSLRLDLVILLKTVGVVIGGERTDARALKEALEYADRTRGHR